MIDVREKIRARLAEKKRSMEWLSSQLGKNPTYIQQFLERRSPRDLRLELKIKTSELLDMPLTELGVSDYRVQKNGPATRTAGKFGEDAEPYVPPRSSILTISETIGYFRMMSNALETHPLGIQPGDVLAFDLSTAAIDNLRNEQIVILQCYHPDPQVLAAKTLVREFVRPSLLLTNRAQDNEAFSLDDASLPFEPHIKGVLRNVVRNEL